MRSFSLEHPRVAEIFPFTPHQSEVDEAAAPWRSELWRDGPDPAYCYANGLGARAVLVPDNTREDFEPGVSWVMPSAGSSTDR